VGFGGYWNILVGFGGFVGGFVGLWMYMCLLCVYIWDIYVFFAAGSDFVVFLYIYRSIMKKEE